MVSAALGEMVKHAQAAYLSGAPTRDAQRRVTAEVSEWATAETLSGEDIRLGLALASEVVAKFGLDYDGIATLNFEPAEASKQILLLARSRDKYWGTEAHYAVAERAVHTTYGALIAQLNVSAGALIPSVRVLRNRLEAVVTSVEASSHRIELTLRDLEFALIAASSTAEVMDYLRTRAEDWDVPRWSAKRKPSSLERQLRLRAVPGASDDQSELRAERALADHSMLVVLGRPGSGKTWLARRLAREAADAALKQLEDGADLGDVELPIMTTWDQWTKADGPPRESLMTAAFQSGLGFREVDAGGGQERLRRTLLRGGQQLLVVVDSLDESADVAGQAARLYELSALPLCRVVVTSRHAAWDAVHQGALDPSEAVILELRDLTYPSDVNAFIRQWFANDPVQGDQLIQQIHSRDDLRRTAVIPLMLTFYCVLGGEQPLPAHRRELYRRLVRRLLRGEWANNPPGADAAPDREYCEALLASWAWHAVGDKNTASGLGDWGDSFTQPAQPREQERRAIDNVAPKVKFDAEGEIVRRFLHRTIMEHFVAEHIATIAADEAAEILLPHLWFDTDWQVAAPAAIAAHNQRDRGALLKYLLLHADQTGPGEVRRLAALELERLLVEVAVESAPEEWTPEHQKRINQSRVKQVCRNPDAVAMSADWRASNAEARAALLSGLPEASHGVVRGLLTALPALITTESDRVEARSAILSSLSTAQAGVVRLLLAALVPLMTTDADRAECRRVVLNLLSASPSSVIRELAAAVPSLAASAGDRAEARSAVLAALPTASGRSARHLAASLPALVVTDADRAEARAAVLDSLPVASAKAVVGLTSVLPRLISSEADRSEARLSVLAALPNAGSGAVRRLMTVLPSLVESEADRAQARAAVFAALDDATPGKLGSLAAGLLRLEPSGAELTVMRNAVLSSLRRSRQADADLGALARLATALRDLDPTTAEIAEARSVVLKALPHTEPGAVRGLLRVLEKLSASLADRAEGDPGEAHRAESHRRDVKKSDAHRAEALGAILASLATAHRRSVRDLLASLRSLSSSDDERSKTRTALLAALSTAEAGAVRFLLEALPAFIASEADVDDA